MMIYKRASAACLAVFLLFTAANAQKAEVTVSLNEAFFDALLDSIYQNFDPPEFSIAKNGVNRGDAEESNVKRKTENGKFRTAYFPLSTVLFPLLSSPRSPHRIGKQPVCNESIKILREMNGVRTAVRFREGKIFVPLAFSGSYAPPFVGCVEFSGWAESNIDLAFDREGQRLVGRVHVLNVNLTGTGGVGGTLIAKMLQGSIDKKLNPIEVLTLDKLSFAFPVSKSGNLKMSAKAVRTEIANGLVNVIVTYQFLKA